MFDSFVKYQRLLAGQFASMQKEFGFEVINGNQRIDRIQQELRRRIGGLLGLSPNGVKEVAKKQGLGSPVEP
jgi:dTMP kinase